MALGGSSNHFRVRSLVSAGAWDEWNVTEDADLGIRLARFGYRVGTFDSDTWEEAPQELGNWFRQRVRWQKGWMRPVNDYLCSRNIKRLVHLQLAELARVATPSQQTGENCVSAKSFDRTTLDFLAKRLSSHFS